ncbi:MAG TPA: NADH-ubiquinone oxidoreductase-F iron-sulfur binding region domain-containing protein, partial [Methylomirabilota bacterium]|nr:NADH-ubiquinone oxidoreductase-F iron-sulfur binding region domain-containing protein [Methylomirabilota bacterium]
GALQALSERLQTPLYQLQGLASFFPHFRLSPPPPVDLGICADMSCHLRGADALRRSVEERVAQAGQGGVVVRPSSCLGQCDRAPAASLNDVILARLTPDTLYRHIETALAKGRLPHPEASTPAERLLVDPYESGERYGALRAFVADPDVSLLLGLLKASELRGLGGAGFPTGAKWEIVRNAAADGKYVVCNADESEPGTIKDRFLMEQVPHLLIEAMVLAGLVIGARTGIIYIRHEYETQAEVLRRELARCQQEGLIGPSVLGSGIPFDLSLFISPGGYICGEESALLEVLQGNRAEPRNKPPFPGTHGLWNKPTIINNVETFVMIPQILRKGPEWFKAQGRSGAAGLKFVGISGHVPRPGVYEIPLGAPAREVLDRAGGVLGGKALKAWAPSGASSGYLPASMIDTPLEFKALTQAGSMLGSGAIIICAEGTCMLDMALNAVRFFKNESCGKCVPCRVGSAKMVDILTDMARGRGRQEDLALIDELSDTLTLTSICGLGQVVPAPIRSVIRHFRDEIDEHIVRGRCPSGVCQMA